MSNLTKVTLTILIAVFSFSLYINYETGQTIEKAERIIKLTKYDEPTLEEKDGKKIFTVPIASMLVVHYFEEDSWKKGAYYREVITLEYSKIEKTGKYDRTSLQYLKDQYPNYVVK